MKKIIYILILSGLLIACDTISSDNGELDGMWYLTKVDTLSNGHSADYRSQKIFWSFQGTLAQFNCSDASGQFYMSYFSCTGSNLKLQDVFYYDRINGDRVIDTNTLYEVQRFGINNLNEDYAIKSMDNSNMILQNDELCLHFEKY